MSTHPQFLSILPTGVDLYEGASQERLSKAICKHITDIDNSQEKPPISRIIGLEGDWGCGKSNVISMLGDKLKDNYYVSTYDAWGYQEDLQRRSVLESLTKELIEKEILTEPTKIKILKEKEKGNNEYFPQEVTCSWQERLDSLAAKKSQTKNYTIPSINNDTKWFALCLLLLGITPAISRVFSFKSCENISMYVFIGLSALIIISFIARMLWNKSNKTESYSRVTKRRWKEMWSLYQTNYNSQTTSFTIAQAEPTDKEFRDWMSDINESLNGKQKLILVFDNMDRIPAEKAKKLWSSIYSFFAGTDYNNIWTIIPYDQEHLKSIFESNAKKDTDSTNSPNNETTSNLSKKYLNSYITKTFPIVFHVPAPVYTDYRRLFKSLFVQAFGDSINDETIDSINRLYRHKNPQPNARNIISFINEMVAIYKMDDQQKDINNIAVYVLNRSIIEKNPDFLLDTRYLGDMTKYIDDTEKRRNEITSLFYGVESKIAEVLPLRIYIQGIIATDKVEENFHNEINEIARNNSNFYVILDEIIEEYDPVSNLINAINKLKELEDPTTSEDKRLLRNIWKKLGHDFQKRYYELPDENDDENYVYTLLNRTSRDLTSSIIRQYYSCIKIFSENTEGKLINGARLFNILDSLNKYIEQSELDVKIPDTTINVPGNVYNEYILAGKEHFRDYEVHTDNIIKYLNSEIDKMHDVSESLTILKTGGNIDMEEIQQHIIKGIETSENIDLSYYGRLFTMAELINKNKIIISQESDTILLSKYNNMLNDDMYKESDSLRKLFIVLTVHHKGITPISNDNLKNIGTDLWRYCSLEELVQLTTQHQTVALKVILKHCIENRVNDPETEFMDNMIEKIKTIKNYTNTTPQQIISYFGFHYKSLGAQDKQLDARTTFPYEWLIEITETQNSLAKSILLKEKEDLEKVGVDTFFYNGLNHDEYWVKVLDILIQGKYYKGTLSPKLIEIGKKFIEKVFKEIPYPIEENSIEKFLLDNLNYKDVSTEIYNGLLNIINEKYNISKTKFELLYKFIEISVKKATINPAGFMNKVLLPIINESSTQRILLENKTFYGQYIQDNVEDSSDLKSRLAELKDNKSTDPKFSEFIVSLNIWAEQKE